MRVVRLCCWLPVLALLSAALPGAQSAKLSLTAVHGGLALSLPYSGQHSGTARVTSEILDPEDRVLGHAETRVQITAPDGAINQFIVPANPIPSDDLPWERLHVRLQYDGDSNTAMNNTFAVSEILRRPVVRILGQSEYLAGSTAAIRVIVSDSNAEPITSGKVAVTLDVPGRSARTLFSGELNRRGTLEAQLHLPSGVTGPQSLHFTAETAIGTAEYTQAIQVLDKDSILLTSEKPIYQPGQTIHVRALALGQAIHAAAANKPLTFELEDSRGNKVFKRRTQTDNFGIASAEFQLAEEVNLGTYHLHATLGDANTAELALNVERYVLPKFKVAVEFNQQNGKPKRDFRPGDHVIGLVRAHYFFGQPVVHAELTVKATTSDVAIVKAAEATGKTDGDGVFHFDLTLPDYFAGQPLAQGSARALIEASVKDSAAHTETRGEPITVSQSALLIQAIPEGGTLIPKLENEVFLLVSYPDGRPAKAAVKVQSAGAKEHQATTDETGAAVIRVDGGSGSESLRIEADDQHGSKASTTIHLESRSGQDQVLLRTSRAVFKPGDRVTLRVLSTRSTGTAYVDLIQSGQTVLTRDLDLKNGEADLTLTATPEMAGTLDLNAYLISRDAQPIADHRLVFVQPSDELKIETSLDRAVYRPGEDARVRFHVTNAHHEGVSAALGVEIVDEAVFALAEKQPGFAKTFFYLEQEVMKPRYEIHAFDMPSVINSEPIAAHGQPDLAGRILFSATELAHPTRVNVEFGREIPQQKAAEFQQRYHDAFVLSSRNVAQGLSTKLGNPPRDDDFRKAFSDLSPRDAWGTPIRLEPVRYWGGPHLFELRSAGPDRAFDTSDDLTAYLRETITPAHRTAGVSGSVAGNVSATDIRIEHDRGPTNNLTEITGTVTDQTGAFIPGATITLHEKSSPTVRHARANASGEFTFNALPAGRFFLDISRPGFVQLITRDISLEPRDRAVLDAVLSIGSATETVEVTATNADLAIADATVGFEAIPAPSPAPMATAAPMFRGGMAQGRAVATMAVKMPAQLASAKATAASDSPAPHVRSYFPEALYINPEIITDGHGDATISVPVADSITTWRMAMMASTRSGSLGSGTGSLKVFQDFFVDLDLPVTLTQGDCVTVPVAIYNYSGKPGKVSLTLQPDAWYSLDKDSSSKSMQVDSDHVGGSNFTLTANRIGRFKLTLTAHMDASGRAAERNDVIVREIEVVPNGREQNLVFNGHLEHTAEHTLTFPEASIPDASAILVRLYPGPLAQIMEGMDAILRMPSGCFEQTSSSTYPNVLALDYMKRTKKLTPEVHAKAEGYIANGYQRLLTFEVRGGGFSWFGQAPANKILTAYGLMEFHDMAAVSDVDPRLIDRTASWLAAQQQPDGSWKPDTSFINEGATNRYNSDVLRITAYIAWSLANVGFQGPQLARARQYIESHLSSSLDTYTLAVIANFAVDMKSDPALTQRVLQALIAAGVQRDDQISWTTGETGFNATGASATVETTGLAAQAILKWGQSSETARKALNFLTAKKDAAGTWGTTQATIMAMKSFLLASERSGGDPRGTVHVLLNGMQVESLELTKENNDLFHQYVFKSINTTQSSSVQLTFEGSGSLAYQVVGRSFTPWETKTAAEPLSIELRYDRTQLKQDDIATATAIIHNNTHANEKMVMVDLGIPPGFELMSEDLQSFEDKSSNEHSGRLQKFSLTATQAILYFDGLAPSQTITFAYRLRAKYPIHARTFSSRVYEYYDPAVNATVRPLQLQIDRR